LTAVRATDVFRIYPSAEGSAAALQGLTLEIEEGELVVVFGPSGSGKSTLSLHCLLQGLDFLAEDSVLVRPDGLLATGVPNFLHARADSLRFVTDASCVAAIRKSRIIRRRSGVEKFEIDLRRPQYRLASAPLRIIAVVFVSPRTAPADTLLAPLRKANVTRELAASQPYAANQPGWSDFCRQVSRLPVYELRRGSHPLQAVEALEGLLPSGPTLGSGGRGRR
jgi:energy-coupling factor transporter ATP-binding protein EcfA2